MVKNPPANAGDPGLGRSSRRKWQWEEISSILAWKSHGQKEPGRPGGPCHGVAKRVRPDLATEQQQGGGEYIESKYWSPGAGQGLGEGQWESVLNGYKVLG